MTHSRIERVNELIRVTLADIIAKELEMPPGVFATIVKVDTSRDLRYTRVFVSVFPEKEFRKCFEILEKNIYALQGMMNKRLKMKPLPRIKFIADQTEVEADKIEKILKEI